MTIHCYRRVSTADQSTEMQTLALRRAVEARGESWESVTQHEDAGLSGKNMRRPGLLKMLGELRRGDVVLVYSLSRLTRSVKDLTHLIETFETRGVTLIAVRDQVDLATPAGRMLVHIIASIAQFEREITAERVRDGMAAARAAGAHIGRSPRLEPTCEDLAILELRANNPGLSGRAIARELGLPQSLVARALQRVQPT